VVLLVLTLQLGVPLAMLVGLLLARPSSKAGVVMNVIATGGWLLATAFAGMWTILPWWTPHALAAVLAAVTMWRLNAFRRHPQCLHDGRFLVRNQRL
jgi:riboflavin transporter FmnP